MLPGKQTFPCNCFFVEMDVCAGCGVKKQTSCIMSRVCMSSVIITEAALFVLYWLLTSHHSRIHTGCNENPWIYTHLLELVMDLHSLSVKEGHSHRCVTALWEGLKVRRM